MALAATPGVPSSLFIPSLSQFMEPPAQERPTFLALDLDGDGLETTDLRAGAFFDHDGDGFAEQTAWVAPADGLLARDLDGDGQITSGQELFGTHTLLPDGSRATDGFQALAAWDDNGDGRIDASDTIYGHLRVWQDLDGDGLSTPEELLPLPDAGVAAIHTDFAPTAFLDPQGNAHALTGTFTRADGTTGVAAEISSPDVWLRTDETFTMAEQWREVPADIAALPDVQGAGTLSDLHQAMVRDTTDALRRLVEAFAAEPNPDQRSLILTDLLFTWAGSTTVDPASRGPFVDARWLALLEQFFGEPFVGADGANPTRAAANPLRTSYLHLRETVYAELMAQTHLKNLYGLITYAWDETAQTVKGDLGAVITELQERRTLDPAAGNVLLEEFIRTVAGLGAETTVDLWAFIDTFYNTVEVPAQGKTFVFGPGSGKVAVSADNVDTIQIAGAPGSISVQRTWSDLFLTFEGTADELRVSRYFYQDTFGSPAMRANPDFLFEEEGFVFRVLSGTSFFVYVGDLNLGRGEFNLVRRGNVAIQFADGTVWDRADLRQRWRTVTGTEGADSLMAYELPAVVSGLGGDDTLVGGILDDRLDGGPGNDALFGGYGSDTYVFARGTGQDVMADADRYLNTVEMGADILPGEVTVERSGNDLVLGLAGTTDRFAIQDYFTDLGTPTSIEVRFADGTAWDDGILQARLQASAPTGPAEPVILTGGGGVDVLEGGPGDDTLAGGDGNDALYGRAGKDMLDGGPGTDRMEGGPGDDTYVVDSAGDTVIDYAREGIDTVVSSITYTLDAGLENLTLTGSVAINGTGNTMNNALTGNSVANVLSGGAGNDTLDGGGGADTLIGGSGNDTYVVDNPGDAVIESGNGIDTVRSSITYTLGAALENLTLTGTEAIAGTGNASNNVLRGNTAANVLTGGPGHDTLDGGPGDDTLIGGPGNDIYVVDRPGDTVVELAGEGLDTVRSSIAYTLDADLEDLTLIGTAPIGGTGNDADNVLAGNTAANVLRGEAGSDVLDGRAGDDILIGGAGDDAYIFARGGGQDVIEDYDPASGNFDTVWIAPGIEPDEVTAQRTGDDLALTIDGGADRLTVTGYFNASDPGFDVEEIQFADGTVWGRAAVEARLQSPILIGTDGNDTLTGGEEDNQISGGAGDDLLSGGAGNDLLDGGPGHDTLDGGPGIDTLTGGPGNDTYVVDDAGDTVTELPGEGTDTVYSPLAWTLGRDVEDLALTGTQAIDGTGNELNNVLTGNETGNVLQGLDGNDTLSGGAGDDTLDGGGGSDAMTGGTGNDVYLVDNPGDTVTEAAGEGTDTVLSAISSTLGADVENLTLTGTAAAHGAGNEAGNALVGNDAANTLQGMGGDDTLSGTGGDDTLDGGMGQDLLDGGPGNDTLDGGPDSDTLMGGSGNDTLIGAIGADTLLGGPGDDTYIVHNVLDTANESLDEGTDAVHSSVTWTLGPNLEHLTLTGTAVIDGTGNSLDNTLTGNEAANLLQGLDGNDTITAGGDDDTLDGGAGNDALDGGAGSDILIGGAGNDILIGAVGADTLLGGPGDDTYIVHNPLDVVSEAADEGTDTVHSSVTWTLDAHVEHLTLTGGDAVSGTGNALNNVLTGNSVANTLQGMNGDDVLDGGEGSDLLDGGAGNDALIGGAGNDTYLVGSPGDAVTELGGQGTDTVLSAVTWILGSGVENLTLTGNEAINATGNESNNMLAGNDASNTLTGMGGDDTLNGGAGGDTLNAGDGHDILDGGAGGDILLGGPGDDTYAVDSSGDVVTELPGEGTDTVQSGVTWTLGANSENLTLTGTGTINATGNELNNVLTGNDAANVLAGGAGNDTLDGGAGNDILIGGPGDDLYIVDGPGDRITERNGEGTDTVLSTITWTLGPKIERLTLVGNAAINGTGNEADNRLTGNAADNVLAGEAGNDTIDGAGGSDTLGGAQGNDTLMGGADHDSLDGGSGNDVLGGGSGDDVLTGGAGDDILHGEAGNDRLEGGAGSDTYLFGRGDGQDAISDQAGNETARFDASLHPLDLILSRQASDLRIAIHGSADWLTVQDWYGKTNAQTRAIVAGDGSRLLNTQVEQLIQAMASFSASTGLAWEQAIEQRPEDVQAILAAHWQPPAGP